MTKTTREGRHGPRAVEAMTTDTTRGLSADWKRVGWDLLEAMNRFLYEVGEGQYARTNDGALPPPEWLKDIESRYPGAANIILRMASVGQTRRHAQETQTRKP